MNNLTTRKLTTIAMLSALGFAAVAFIRIPMVLFLEYSPKDVIIVLGGFIWGPFTAIAVSLITSLIELFTISSDGIIGFIMNVLASCSFACTAAFIYKKDRTLRGSIIGLVSGTLAMTVMMIIWNYLVTPIYLGYPRSAVVELLVPAILPFNLIKGGLNSAIVFLIYKPIVTALRKTVMKDDIITVEKGKVHPGMIIVAGVVIVTCIMVVLAMRGII